MKIAKIIWHIIGISCAAMILPSFVSSITTAILSLQPQRLVIFFMYPMMTSRAAAEVSSARAFLNMGLGYLMYIIAFVYVILLTRQIMTWYKKAKKYDAEHN
ncbi:hypothetical protein [Listeria fleischmannii]|jgi:hypothetical protein|uniref:Lipoprotein n=2 Tax=Listeria fleischmannii TaxID=1069827 RepID=W7DA56_9LIST|nr:hypothetical protein [Listeria fleischmannii]EIA19473.1 hypothetical protein KKC_12195 [Listeria fleischmannii subsp. coloradonensis]EUJ51426.1 lipoprotein [Listeria fleischmannii FSL S10-1203]MBC1398156.1 hypothetical protein [Listeria fleischmannii]MBC1418008.1 hypothetical protein [Listeria fleischmannii]MBC1426217.1 hypothetical protein [Listeria fleischmannii]